VDTPRQALLLAAGRGERLRPFTDHTPKPLLTVQGQTLIGWHLARLKQAGVTKLLINTSWLHEQFEAALGDGSRFGVHIDYRYEGEVPLETAGAIVNVLDWFEGKPFGVISSDVFCEALPPPIPKAIAGRLWMVNNPSHHPGGDFALEAGECRKTGPRTLTYSGIGSFRPEAFVGLAPGRRPLRPLLERWLAVGQLQGLHCQGEWTDVGTPERLAGLNQGHPTYNHPFP
jgi:MurNAc alpha-1-phosphate uridylyltransferase